MYSNDYFTARSFWTINDKWVYIEQNDDIGLEQKLREISLNYSHRADNNTRSQLSTSRKDKIEGALWLATIIFFVVIVFLNVKGYISEKVGIPLLVIAGIAVIALRFYDLKEDYDKLKWKK